MKKNNFIIHKTAILFCVLQILSCTGNPFGDDDIQPTGSSVSGNIKLDKKNQPEKVFVWLEGFNQSTYTDKDGNFTLTIEPELYSNISGIYKLYFYVANYKLTSLNIAVKNGEFLPEQEALGKNGKLRQNVEMVEFLHVYTKVDPSSVPFNFNGTIKFESAFQASAENDTVTVVFPKTVEQFLGPVFIKNTETDNVFIFESIPLNSTKTELVGHSPSIKSITYTFYTLSLPIGSYKVIPYFLIQHEQVPDELLNAIGTNLQKLSLNYLKVPMCLEGGYFKVM